MRETQEPNQILHQSLHFSATMAHPNIDVNNNWTLNVQQSRALKKKNKKREEIRFWKNTYKFGNGLVYL